jgi:hypothetical protein
MEGGVAARSAKPTDERGNLLSPGLVQLCGDILSDMFEVQDSRTSPPVATGAINPTVPFLRMNTRYMAPSEVLKFTVRKVQDLNGNLAASHGSPPLYITLRDLESGRYAAGRLVSFANRGTFIYPLIKGMFNHLGLPPVRTTFASPILIQKAGPVMRSTRYR